MTPIDTAHAAMESAPDDDAARLTFYDRFSAAELFLLLETESEGETIQPRVFETADGPFVLAFDLEARLSEFNAGPAPYAAISGRTLAAMLDGQDIGIGLNLGVAPSSFLMAPEAVAWLNETLDDDTDQIEETPEEVSAPTGLPEKLVTAIDARLAAAKGLAKMAYLAGVTYQGGKRGHLLAFVDALHDAEDALAQTTREALVFSGLEAGVLDVTFLRASDPIAGQLARVGLRFDIPQRDAPSFPKPPGMDPNTPPTLH